ncbi:MAG: cysteine hydrolase [Clostridia bacterium]|nr:cysteine hydrolase [Clostridia bacterium]
MRFLIVVDMQNDFISGSLGSSEAQAIVPRVVRKVASFQGTVVFTRDTHTEEYLSTQEGKNLPVLHCVKGTDGWQICKELAPYAQHVVDKGAFGSIDLPAYLGAFGDVEEVELCGLCTDICVISNAILLKSAYPEATMKVDASCCAGVTEERHNTALCAMRAVQIQIL